MRTIEYQAAEVATQTRRRLSGWRLHQVLSSSVILFAAIFLAILPEAALANDPPIIRIGIDTPLDKVTISSESDWYIGIDNSGKVPVRVPAGRTWSLQALGDSEIGIEDGDFRKRIDETLYVFVLPARDGSSSGDAGAGRDGLSGREVGRDSYRDAGRESSGSRGASWRDDATLKVGSTSYRGELKIWARDGKLYVINYIDLESYLLGVVPLEIGGQSAERYEAIKAQTVAARSYTLSMLGRWEREGYDLKSTVEDQAYGGFDAENERCTAAVSETEGVVAVWNSQPIRAYYSSTSGGHTASPSEVWEREDYPYLRAVRNKTSKVDDSFCSISPFYKWEELWTIDEFEAMIDRQLPRQVPSWSRKEYGAFRDIEIVSRSESKRVADLALHFERGSVHLHGDKIRWAVRRPDGGGLRSTLLERVGVLNQGGRPTQIKVRGRGYGHGVGLCQYGAMRMSEVGYDYSQILRFYYRGTELRRYY